MFEKILYPTDFSDTARKAMGVVKELRTAGAQEVVALHVIDQRSIDTLNEFAASSVPTLELEEEVSKNMGQLENELRGAGFSVEQNRTWLTLERDPEDRGRGTGLGYCHRVARQKQHRRDASGIGFRKGGA